MASRLPRISYGFLSASAEPINIKLPWQISNQTGMWKMNFLPEDAMKDSLSFWAQTNKGEYVMDLEFGLDVRRSLFLPAEILINTIENNAREQLPKYFPKFKLNKMEILTNENHPDISEHSIIFKLDGYLAPDKNRRVVVSTEIGQ